MYEVTRQEVTKFLNTFNLKIEDDGDDYETGMHLIDPYGERFTFFPSYIYYTFPENSDIENSATKIDLKRLVHVIKSLNEFADYWRAKLGWVEMNYNSNPGSDVDRGHITLMLR